MNSTDQVEYDLESKLGRLSSIIIGSYLLVLGVSALVVHVYLCRKLHRYHNQLNPLDRVIYPVMVYDVLMLTLIPMPVASCFAGRWLFGHTGCVIYGFFGFVFGVGNISTLMVVAVIKYIAVCRWEQRNVTDQFTARMCAAALAFTLVWSICPLVGFGSYGPEPNPVTCSVSWTSNSGNQRAFLITILIFCGVLPFGVISVCYAKIFCKSKGTGSLLNDRSTSVFKYWMFISFGYLSCWAPYAVVSAASVAGYADHIPYIVHTIPVLCAKSTVILDPLVYVVANTRLRNRMIIDTNSDG